MPSVSLLLLFFFIVSVHGDPRSDGFRCILDSPHQTALERWIHCLPSLLSPLPNNPPQDRVLDHLSPSPIHSLLSATASPQAPNSCNRETLRDTLLGASGLACDHAHPACCPDIAADERAEAIGGGSSTNESFEFQTFQALAATNGSPVADSDAVDLVDGGAAIGENQLDERNQCMIGKDMSIATDGLAGADKGAQLPDNLDVSSHLLEAKDTLVADDAHQIFAADNVIAANLLEDSSGVSISEVKIQAVFAKTATDCEVESFENGAQGDAFSAVLRLNVLSALFLTLMTNCWRKTNRNKSRRWKRSRYRLQGNLGAAQNVRRTILRAATAEIDGPKTVAGELRPGKLGAPLGTAIGAVFAEVFLNESCSCRPSLSADEIGTLLETAMRESLTPIVGVGLLVDDFMASFQSAYKTICRVHQACPRNSRNVHHTVGEMACVRPSSEHETSANARKFFCRTGENFDPLNSKFSQQINYVGDTDAVKDDLQDICKDVHGVRQQDSHGEAFHSVGKNGNKISCVLLRKNRELQSGFCTAMDVSEKLFSGNNSSIERGECSTVESTREEGTLQWNGILSASQRNLMTGQSMMLPTQGFSKSKLAEDPSSSCPFPHAQQPGNRHNVYTELSDTMEDLSLHGNDDEIGHWARNIASSRPVELSSEDKETAILDSQSDDENTVIQGHSDILQPAGGLLDAVVLASQAHRLPEAGWKKTFLHIFEKSVQAQEQHNYFKSIELAHLLRQLTLGEKQLQLSSVSNDLMKEHIDLSRSKASFKESTVLERRLKAAHVEFSRTCADELVAGLFIMLLSLAHSVRRYSSALLFDLVSTCQFSAKEQHRSSWLYIDWFYNSLDSLTGQLQAFVCHVTVAGRILIGLTIVAVVSYLLLRQTVTSSNQSMSAVIIIIVLGVICGLAGKVSVDSLGGNGLHWLVMWEMLCTLHALANCFTPFIFKLVNGSPLCNKTKFQFLLWLRRFVFHFTIVLVLPILAGQLPFGSIGTVSKDLLSVFNDTIFSGWNWMGNVI